MEYRDLIDQTNSALVDILEEYADQDEMGYWIAIDPEFQPTIDDIQEILFDRQAPNI